MTDCPLNTRLRLSQCCWSPINSQMLLNINFVDSICGLIVVSMFHEGCCLRLLELELRHFRGLLENWNQTALDYQHLLHLQMLKTGYCRLLQSMNLNRLILKVSKSHLLNQQFRSMTVLISPKHNVDISAANKEQRLIFSSSRHSFH